MQSAHVLAQGHEALDIGQLVLCEVERAKGLDLTEERETRLE